MTVTGIVLAGGRSTRMGRDKASLPFGTETLLQRAIRIVGEVTDEVVVVARPGATSAPCGGGNPFLVHRSATREGGLGLPVRVVHDPVADLGPLAGLAAGLSASTTELNIVVACDMPLIKPAVLRRLVELLGDAAICVAVVDGHASPLCAVYRSSVAGVAQQLLGDGERRVMALLDRVQTKRVEAAMFRDLDPDLDSFVSCNTPEAYAAALVRLTTSAKATAVKKADATRS
ncbi:MAG: molybdenum cofactor guanylyltransferase [Acidobacteriota bacterium]|nr:molybdenum cofactor guanylyltransferase [Acidobacteriota bacterium]